MITNVSRPVVLTALALHASLNLVGCSEGTKGRSAAPAASVATPTNGPVAVATLKELMDSTVDPAADGLWEAVAVISTANGDEHRQPRTPEEWAAVRRHAMTLIEAMNLVVLSGRHAAPAGTKPGLGELTPAEIDQGIEQKRVLFTTFARALQVTAQQALVAIDQKDIEGIVKTGGDFDAACEVCHVIFWYPDQRK